jgi:hypothetical protein
VTANVYQRDSVQIETITPDQAHEYLGFNTHNRNFRPRLVSAYAADMRNGDWRWNGESIKFDRNGVMIDGQHRCAASVEANASFQTLVIRGLSPESQDTIDTGATRKFSDVLKLRGETSYVTLATTIRAIAQWESGSRTFSSGGSATNAQLLVTLEKHGWVRDGLTVINHVSHTAGLASRVGGLAWWLFTQIDAEDADEFFRRLSSDEDHRATEPIYELRRAINNSFSVRGERSVRYLLAITIKAWNKYRDGEMVGLLRFRPGGAKPEPFPEPK